MNGQEIKEYLIENYHSKTIPEIAKHTGLKVGNLYGLVSALKLTGDLTGQSYFKTAGKISRTIAVDKSTVRKAYNAGYRAGLKGNGGRVIVKSVQQKMSYLAVSFIALASFVLGAVIGIII